MSSPTKVTSSPVTRTTCSTAIPTASKGPYLVISTSGRTPTSARSGSSGSAPSSPGTPLGDLAAEPVPGLDPLTVDRHESVPGPDSNLLGHRARLYLLYLGLHARHRAARH